MDKYNLNYQQYGIIINKLIKKLKDSQLKFDYVYGIPRGGLPLAVELSHKLNIPFTTEADVYSLDDFRVSNNILIVDDLVDTGKTFKFLEDSKFYEGWTVITEVLFKKPWSKFHPNFYVYRTDKWIIFPYEKEDEQVLSRCEEAMINYMNEKKINE